MCNVRSYNVRLHNSVDYTQMCRHNYCNIFRFFLAVCVCIHESTSPIHRGINPIHYLAELRAAQSIGLSVAADELPALTRCIIQTCRTARLSCILKDQRK